MLRNLLKRLHGGLHNVQWGPGEREQFMSNLVEAHAAAVKPSLASAPLPTVAVSEAAAAAAEQAAAAGDIEAATRARALAEAMARAPEPPAPGLEPEIVRDRFADLALLLPSLPGSARCAARIYSPTARDRRLCRSRPMSLPSDSAPTARGWSKPSR
ncbi:MAG: DUF1631 domain-containing protein [Betaproteobacteria bacterium]|nr:MAG: DUF1631 domain-containing protein [Betaproteobacteria bacterium]